MRTIIALFFAASSGFAPLAPGSGYQPLGSETYSQDLVEAGYRNGRMPDLRMISVGNCLLERDGAYSLALMIEAADQDDIDLVPGDCYRTYGAQQAARERRCPEVVKDLWATDATTGEMIYLGTVTVRECTGPPIAVAGASNHGWGRAIDFTRNGRASLDCNDAAFRWLLDNGSRFGWVHPTWAGCGLVSAEPWHWEWAGVEVVAIPLPPVEVGRAQ
jgi:D-alanyl-D-alanine dipeptidase